MLKIIQKRKIWFAFSSILVIASIAALLTWGLKLGIDFTGGTLMEFTFKDKPLNSQEIKDSLKDLNLGDMNVQFSGNQDVLLKLKDIDEETHQKIIKAIEASVAAKNGSAEDAENKAENKSAIEEKRFDSIGPVIGNELKSDAFWAILVSLVGMVLYIGWAFRKVSRPVSSASYGVIADIALFHDVIITAGVFSVLGHYYNVEVGIWFLAVILTVLGYSINDTIVVFDRTRENLLKSNANDFEEVVNQSVNETLIRSLNTSFTVLLALSALYLFGGETIKYFVVALMAGIAVGTYSSIFIASPLLVTWQKRGLRKNS